MTQAGSLVESSPSRPRSLIVLGVLLLLAGLCGHLFAARAIGGYYIAYRDHIFGWVLFAVVSTLIIVPLGWKFWRGRPEVSVLAIGVLQAVLGFLIYLERFNIH